MSQVAPAQFGGLLGLRTLLTARGLLAIPSSRALCDALSPYPPVQKGLVMLLLGQTESIFSVSLPGVQYGISCCLLWV